jgi:hypothetical protein
MIVELTRLIKEFQKAMLLGEFEKSADIAVDMSVICVKLQQWSEIKLEESRQEALR